MTTQGFSHGESISHRLPAYHNLRMLLYSSVPFSSPKLQRYDVHAISESHPESFLILDNYYVMLYVFGTDKEIF